MRPGLSDEEIKLAADLLSKLDIGYLPTPIFDQTIRLVVCSTIVIVPLKQTAKGFEVLLRLRGDEPTNPVWPNHWHLPGTMLRPTDKPGDYSDAFNRLQDEMGGTVRHDQLRFIRTAFTQTKRGRELTQLYYMMVTGGKKLRGAFYPIDKLPAPILEHEIAYIREAASKASGQN